MTQLYLDGSGSGSADIFVFAGYLAPSEAWAKFHNEWKRLLDGTGPPHYRKLDIFKMTQMQSEADRERCGWFYRVIEDHVSAAISCVIYVDDLQRVVREAPYSTHVGNFDQLADPYYFALKAVMDTIFKHAKDFRVTEPVDFIFDDESKDKVRILAGWEYLKRNTPNEFRYKLGNTPIWRNDRYTLPLQAADLWAWWVRYWEVNGIIDGVEKLRFDWKGTRKDIPRGAMVYRYDALKENFDRIFGTRVYLERLRRHWPAMPMSGEHVIHDMLRRRNES